MLRQTVPDVDYADLTTGIQQMKWQVNEEAFGCEVTHDGPVLIDTTQPNNETTTGVLGGTTGAAERTKCSLDHEFFGSEDQ